MEKRMDELSVPKKKFRLLDTGANFEEDISFEEWRQAGAGLFEIHKMSAVWIGDWLTTGERKFGETFSDALEITGLSIDSLAHYRSTMGRVPPEVRQPGLSLSHYREVAKLPTEDQARFLKEAAEKQLSVRKLAELVSGKPIVERRCCHRCGRTGVSLVTICNDCNSNQGENQ